MMIQLSRHACQRVNRPRVVPPIPLNLREEKPLISQYENQFPALGRSCVTGLAPLPHLQCTA
jgi:hypothetical protein